MNIKKGHPIKEDILLSYGILVAVKVTKIPDLYFIILQMVCVTDLYNKESVSRCIYNNDYVYNLCQVMFVTRHNISP